MNRASRPEVLDLQKRNGGSVRSRSRSAGSIDNPLSSTASDGSIFPALGNALTSVAPEAAYIASSAAARLVTSDHEGFFRTLQTEGIIGPGNAKFEVSDPSLRLVNQFLDFLLYSFLSAAKSTALTALRPAVTEVLRARLASEAVAGADQELDSYLGGEAEESAEEVQKLSEAGAEGWDLERTWKRARLQCMVYSSLGDLEEDDEAFYSEFGKLEGTVGPDLYQAQSSVPGNISPAVAIWLTSILEFVGEQTLLVAGHATIARYSAQRIAAATSQLPDGQETSAYQPTVEELDTEKVALNPSLGRMWRQWRKRVRGPVRENTIAHSRRGSTATTAAVAESDKKERVPAEETNGSEPAKSKAIDEEQPEGVVTQSSEEEVVQKVGLTPIVESATSWHGDEAPMNHADDSDIEGDHLLLPTLPSDSGEKPRPQSLIMLPWTSESPFVLRWREAIKRPRSLPAISRGEFADPANEGKEIAEDEIAVVPAEDMPEANAKDEGTAVEGAPENSEEAFFTPVEERPMAWAALVEQGSSHEAEENAKPHVPTDEHSFGAAVPIEPADTSADAGKEETPVKEDGVEQEAGVAEREVVAERDVIDNQEVEEQDETPTDAEPISMDKHDELPSGSLGSVEATRPPMTATESTDTVKAAEPATQEQHCGAHIVEINDLPEIIIPHDMDKGQGQQTTVPEVVAHNDRDSPVSLAPISETDLAPARISGNSGDGAVDTTHYSDGEPRKASHAQRASTSSIRSKHSQHSERKLGQITLVNSNSSERSTGVRVVSTPPVISVPTEKSRRSSSFSRGTRPIHTSSSGSSQASTKLKSFIPWPSENAKHHRVPEPDTESRSSMHSARGLSVMDDKERSFEELISSGDTIHCTITPDPIRNMETQPPVPKTPTSDLAEFFRSTGPDGLAAPRAASYKSPASPRSLHSAPAPLVKDDGPSSSLAHFLKSSVPGDAPRSPTSNYSQSSKNQRMLGGVSANSQPSSPKSGTFGASTIAPGEITCLPAVIRQTRAEAPAPSPYARSRLLAREASGSTGSDTTSALADFFRNTTPPVDGEPPVHRISRSVAPFRNTMDSEQFDTGDLPDESDSHHEPSFTTSPAPHDSYQSSFNSSSALIRNNSRKDYGSTSSVPETKRKQSRVKDPYAIDIDELDDDIDDEDDEDMLDLVIPRKKEESLIDFLNSVPPPPSAPPQPMQISDDMKKNIQKKSSSVSLISRFGRSSSRKNSIVSNGDKVPAIPPMPSNATKYVPLMVDTPRMSEASDMSKPGSSQSAVPRVSDFEPHHRSVGSMSGSISGSMSGSMGRVPPRGNVAARGARTERNDTDSLADFLKHTAPPAPIRAPSPPPKEESRGGVLKMFSRTKKRNQVGVA